MEKQVNKEKYDFERYCYFERWSSYWYQLKEILDAKPELVLEIGVGDKTTSGYIKNHTKIGYRSVDIAEDLRPDLVGSVDAIPLPDNSCDVVCAFEVLEHLPYDRFAPALRELARVASRRVLISLPHWGRHFAVEIRLPGFGSIKWQKKFSLWPIRHVFAGEHYWEIGKKGYDMGKIKKEIRNAGLEIIKDYLAFASPYHHFFILEKFKKQN